VEQVFVFCNCKSPTSIKSTHSVTSPTSMKSTHFVTRLFSLGFIKIVTNCPNNLARECALYFSFLISVAKIENFVDGNSDELSTSGVDRFLITSQKRH
jgi:hypothetical protein